MKKIVFESLTITFTEAWDKRFLGSSAGWVFHTPDWHKLSLLEDTLTPPLAVEDDKLK